LSYELWSTLIQTSAMTVAASKTMALAVWVRRNLRSGAWRRRHLVSPLAGLALGCGCKGPRSAQAPSMDSTLVQGQPKREQSLDNADLHRQHV
jgi:hypothetical protein